MDVRRDCILQVYDKAGNTASDEIEVIIIKLKENGKFSFNRNRFISINLLCDMILKLTYCFIYEDRSNDPLVFKANCEIL